MKLAWKNIWIILVLGSLVILQISCASKETDDYSQTLSDLQQFASSVDSFSIPSKDDASSSQKTQLISKISGADSSRAIAVDNVEEYEFSDETGTYSYRSEYYDIDGVTPLTENEALQQRSYIDKQTSSFRNEKFESHFSMIATLTNNDIFSGFPDLQIVGSGVVDYYNDNLVLKAKTVFISIIKDAGIIIKYEMSFMEDKYNFVLEATYTLEELFELTDEQAPVQQLASGEIRDRSGNTVGIFILNSDDSVIIKDRDGNVIQNAGN